MIEKPSNFGSSKFSPDWGPKDMDKDLDKKELLNDKYLSAMPIYPEKGKYEILPEYDVKCSVYENLSKFDK